ICGYCIFLVCLFGWSSFSSKRHLSQAVTSVSLWFKPVFALGPSGRNQKKHLTEKFMTEKSSCLPVDLGFSVINFFCLRRACSQSADTAFFSSAQTNENLSISRRARRSLRFKKAWFDSADTRGRDNPQRRRSFIPHSESRTPHWPERLRKTRGK